MSVSSIIDQTTGKIYDDLIPQGGGINLAKGQIITATATQEVAFPIAPPADGSILSYDSNELTGLKYIAVPGAVPIDYQELISANNANAPTIVPAPLHNGYVLTADNDPANATGLAWKAVGGSGTLTATAPLIDEEVANVSTISINYTAVKGEIPAGSGVAKTGVLVPAPPQDKYVLTSASAEASGLKWLPPTGASGIIDANAPLVDDAGVGTNTISINFSASVGEIPYGNGTAKIGALTVAPNPASSNQFLGTTLGVPTWKNVGGSSISGILPIVEIVGAQDESQIAIGFQSAGQIPYGTATNTGTLTNAPVAGQILGMAGTPAVPTWIDAGGSGTITGTFPIVEAGSGGSSVISIGFTNKGELPVGSGTANTGVILPPASADDYVLSSFSSAPSGMRWVAPTITQNIIRSKTATTIVPDPQTTQDTLILVAEDPDGSWDIQENPTDPGIPVVPYAIEAVSASFTIGAVSATCYAVPEIVNAIRCIRIFIITNSDIIPVGILYQGSYASPALVAGILTPIPPPVVAYASNCFIVYGSFEFFHADGANPPPDVDCGGIALIDCSQIATEVITVKPLIDVAGQIGNNITGVSISQGGPVNIDPAVNKIINFGNYLWIFGNFDGFANGATSITGWWSIAKWSITTGGYDTAGTTVAIEGLAVSFDANVSPGVIEDAYLGFANNLYIVGAWSFVASVGSPIAWNPVVPGMSGFAVWVQGQNPNPWITTPTVAGGFQAGTCIRPSLTQVGYLMMTGSTPIDPLFYELTSNVLIYSTGAIPPAPQQGWRNCIASSANIDIGFGVNTYDFVQYQDKTSGDMFVIWFVLTATPSNPPLATALLPSPTGLKPYFVPNLFPPSYNGPYTGFTSYGIEILTLPTPNINVMATGGVYRFDPAVHANLDFTGSFFYNGVAKTTARFSTATQGNESQSFVSSTSLKAWIQTGAKTTSLTYLP